MSKKTKKKTLAKLKQEVQKLVNKVVRERDKGKPCVSCGQLKTLQAGHYYPVSGYDGLRFDLDNIHGECAGCNCFDHAHLIHYTENIPDRIGEERLKDLHEKAKDYKMNGYRWTRAELEEIKKEMNQKLLEYL